MKILVTGGAGFIGSNFIRLVLESRREYKIVNYDLLTYAGNLTNLGSSSENLRYRFVQGDVCDAGAVEAAMRGCDTVVHFAAESHVDRSIHEPARVIETNITGTFILMQAARKEKLARFVHISTDEVYGDLALQTFAAENSPLRPSSPYSSSKASADMLVLSYFRTYGFPAVITRSSNNYGPYQFPEKFLPLLISNALSGKPLPIYGDGRQQRNWIHVEDNCKGILAVLEGGHLGEVYNIGSSDVEENIAMATRVIRITGKPNTRLTFVKDRPGHDRRYALNCEKIRNELGWECLIPLEQGLQRTISWYQSNADWLDDVHRNGYRAYYEKYYRPGDSRRTTLRTSLKPLQ
jgi:dTDP-glucose 4,6-dehydratase